MSSQTTHTLPNIHPLAHILDTSALIFSCYALFSLSQPHNVMASHPSPGDNHQSTGGRSRSKRIQGLEHLITLLLRHSVSTFFFCIHYETHAPVCTTFHLSPPLVLYHLQITVRLSETCHHSHSPVPALSTAP